MKTVDGNDFVSINGSTIRKIDQTIKRSNAYVIYKIILSFQKVCKNGAKIHVDEDNSIKEDGIEMIELPWFTNKIIKIFSVYPLKSVYPIQACKLFAVINPSTFLRIPNPEVSKLLLPNLYW